MKTHAVKTRKMWAALLGLMVSEVVIGLIVSEVVVRLFVPVRHVGPPVTVYDSVYATGLKRSFSALQITPEFRMRITTNSLGSRQPEPTGSLRNGLLYLGDSFTVGYGVNDGEEYAALIDKRIAEMGAERKPYINAGRGNTGQGHWVKFLRYEGPNYDPHIVVLQINDTDFGDNLRDGLVAVDSNGQVIELPLEHPRVGRVVQPLLEAVPFFTNSYLYGLLRQAYFTIENHKSAPYTPDPDRRARQDQLLLRLLTEVARLCKEGDWPAVALRVALDSSRDAMVDSVLTANGIPSARIAGRGELPGLYYAVDGHWNAKGHERAADVVMDLLMQVDPTWLGNGHAGH